MTLLQDAMDDMRKKQSLINSLLEETGDYVLIIDKDYKVLALNDAQRVEMKRRYQKNLNEGDHILDFLKEFPEARSRVEELAFSPLKGERVFLEKYRSVESTADGNPIYYRMELLPIRDEDKEVIGAAIVYRNITYRVMADEQIEYVIRETANLSEEEFFSNISAQIYKIFKPEHIYLGLLDDSSNSITTKTYLHKGVPSKNFSFELDGSAVESVLSTQVFTKLSQVSRKYPKDGMLEKWGSDCFWGIPLRSPSTGNTRGIFALANSEALRSIPNIDYLFHVIALRAGAEIERISNQARLKARDQQLEDITSNLPEVIYEYINEGPDDIGNFTFVSQAVEEIYEVRAEDLYRNPAILWKSLYRKDLPSFVSKIRESGQNMTTFSWTGRLIGKNSYKLRWVKITARPQPFGENQIKWHGVIDDITRIKHIEQELQHAKARAEDLAKSKEDFLAVMSHEIRTPLNGIMGITNIMIEESDESQMEYLNLLKFSAENLMNLINNILDLSKINAGKIEIFNSKVNLELLLKNLQHSHEHRASENSNKLEFKLDPSLPSFVIGDDMILLQIFNNLLSNAIKFTMSGKVELVANVLRQNKQAVEIRFEVNDSGVGISEEDLAVIFDEFTQVGAKSRKAGGSGLGLGIARKLLELLESELEVESKVGEGSKFGFDLRFDLPQ